MSRPDSPVRGGTAAPRRHPVPRLPAGTESTAARIDALYREYAARVGATVARAVHARVVDVEDSCQYAWAALVRRPDVLDGSSPRGWLTTVAVHHWLAERRRAVLPMAAVERLQARVEDGPDAALEAVEALARVAALRPVRRRVFARHLAGLSYAEIMAELGLTYSNVNRQMRRARAELRDAA
jgi:RNA polymerase sigma factor (sigma-70 family)